MGPPCEILGARTSAHKSGGRDPPHNPPSQVNALSYPQVHEEGPSSDKVALTVEDKVQLALQVAPDCLVCVSRSTGWESKETRP